MKTLGIDIGTTSISGTIIDVLSGKQLDTKTMLNSTQIVGQPWSSEQDAEQIYRICQRMVAEYTHRWDDIVGIGITGQMHGIVYLDEMGNLLSRLYTWEDGRGDLEFTDGMNYAEFLSGKTGYPMSTGFGLTTHFYNQVNGVVPQDACKIATVMDFVAMRLCGRSRPVMHASNAAGLGCFDLSENCFDLAALTRAGIDPGILPDISENEIVIGQTEEGIPVIVPIGDNQAGIYGVVGDDNDVVLNIGTSSQISVICSGLEETADLECRPYVGGKYLLLGAGLCGGSSFKLLNDFFCQVCGMASAEVSEEQMFSFMMEAAEQAYKSENVDDLQVHTLFRGKRKFPGISGSIGNIKMSNLTPGNLTLGFYKGVCEELYEAYQKMPVEQTGGKLFLCGNAIRNNDLLQKVCRDIFSREVYLPVWKEEAAAGAAKLAMDVVKGFSIRSCSCACR
ncbi:MAG: hypothetical protein LIP12_04750 [Clostridiales bacterium]|nr:hypothetical protein [Clostridiales bacterium]